ncbi:MAG: DUF5752 family protein [Patescibacteria group bacterium]
MPEETLSADIARSYLRDVEPMWKAFWFHMHLVAKNLEEFAAGLAAVNADIYAYHASGQKNDFAAWVQEVIGDSVLARRLEAASDQATAASIVRERVEELRASLR